LVNLFRPVYHGFRRRSSKHFASLLSCILIVLLVFVPLIFFVIALSKEAVAYAQYIKAINLADQIKTLIQNNTLLAAAESHLADMGFALRADDVSAHLSAYASNAAFFLYNMASAWAANIVIFMVAFALMIVVIFFLLVDYDRLLDFLLRLSPLPDRQHQQLIEKFQEIAQALLVGNGICGLLQGVVGGLLFVYFDFSSPILWGMIMAVAAFLPIVGIGLVLLPTALIVLLNGHAGQSIFIIIFYLTVSMAVDYLLKPQLVGRKVNMHPILVFLGILGGIKLFGVLGIIYGPLIITGFLTMADIYLESYAPTE
jgi:predicted PurR-regulated permease PerM